MDKTAGVWTIRWAKNAIKENNIFFQNQLPEKGQSKIAEKGSRSLNCKSDGTEYRKNGCFTKSRGCKKHRKQNYNFNWNEIARYKRKLNHAWKHFTDWNRKEVKFHDTSSVVVFTLKRIINKFTLHYWILNDIYPSQFDQSKTGNKRLKNVL